MKKFWKFEEVPDSDWTDWKWQVKHRLKNNSDIQSFFPNLEESLLRDFEYYRKNFNFSITPYTLSLIELDENKNPVPNDPIWKQFRFYGQSEMEVTLNMMARPKIGRTLPNCLPKSFNINILNEPLFAS